MTLLRSKKINWHEFILFWVIRLEWREMSKKQKNQRSVDPTDCARRDAFREREGSLLGCLLDVEMLMLFSVNTSFIR